jgi:hypothetical protein
MKNALNENHSNTKLNAFIGSVISEQDLARTLRRASYLISLSFMRSAIDDTNPMNPHWVDETFYYLNEMAECLSPSLEEA